MNPIKGVILEIVFGETKTKEPFADVRIGTREKVYVCKIWADQLQGPLEQAKELLIGGRVVQIQAKEERYKDKEQWRVLSWSVCTDENPFDFVPNSRFSIHELKTRINRHLKGMDDGFLKKLTLQLLVDHGHAFFVYQAGAQVHHDYASGLAEHVVEMLDFAAGLLTIRPDLDHNLLVAGIILHDIGKVQEYLPPLPGGTTRRGRMIGHIGIGLMMVQEALSKIGGVTNEQEAEQVDMVLHIIASHHGRSEWGALREPQFEEAELIHLFDMMSSRSHIYQKNTDNHLEGVHTKVYPLGDVYHRMFRVMQASN